MRLSDCRMIDLPKILDHRGNLTFIEANQNVPFDIKRVSYLYDVPGGAKRGGHAHKRLQQFIIAAMGSFDVVLDDGFENKRFHLNRSYYGLYIPRMIFFTFAYNQNPSHSTQNIKGNNFYRQNNT